MSGRIKLGLSVCWASLGATVASGRRAGSWELGGEAPTCAFASNSPQTQAKSFSVAVPLSAGRGTGSHSVHGPNLTVPNCGSCGEGQCSVGKDLAI